MKNETLDSAGAEISEFFYNFADHASHITFKSVSQPKNFS